MIAKEPPCREARTSIGRARQSSGRSPVQTSALDDFSNLNLPESVNRGVASSLYKGAPESLRSVAKQTQARRASGQPPRKGRPHGTQCPGAGVGFPIPFARRFARVTARPQTAIDPIKIAPRWKNIKFCPGGAHTFTKATSHGLRVRIWPKPANALPMVPPAKVLSLCCQSECNLDPEDCKSVVLRAVLTKPYPLASLLRRVVSPLARPGIPFSTEPSKSV